MKQIHKHQVGYSDNNAKDDADERYGDSDFLAYRDIAIDDFRKSEKDSKIQIIKKMLEIRHNLKYNKHLLDVYLKAKTLFDTMVDEHRAQITYLEEIYNHINGMIRENHANIKKVKDNTTSELLKDKKRIGILLKKMRNSYEKLTNVYTVIDVTVQKMNEIVASMEEAEAKMDDENLDEDEELDENEDLDDSTENPYDDRDSELEYTHDEDDDEDDDEDEDDEEDEKEEDEDEDEDDEDEDEDEDDEDEDEDEEDAKNKDIYEQDEPTTEKADDEPFIMVF